MAYSLNHGVENEGVDSTQRSLLIGLPAIALVLSFGAIKHHATNGTSAAQNAKTIPIVSSLSAGNDNPSGSSNGSGSGSDASTAALAASNTSSTSSQASSVGTGTSPGSTSGSNSTTPVGGRGGGPIGGGGVTLPDCSIGQIATVNCRVPACSPEVNLSPGQKAILGVAGTCIVVN
jgi:hypothetical protein